MRARLLASGAIGAVSPRALAPAGGEAPAAALAPVRAALVDAGVEVEEAQVAQRPKSLVPLDEDGATKLLRLIEALDGSGRQAACLVPE